MESKALNPVEPEPGVLVHTSADRRLAVEHWLLSTTKTPQKARQEWTDHGVAVLPLGGLMSTVRMPGRLVLAVAGGRCPSGEVDDFLEEFLDGGPVICDPRSRVYYVLVPGSMPRSWKDAADEWRGIEADCLGRGVYLGVPRVDRTEFDPAVYASYWSVPMASAGELCSPLLVARLIAAGRHMLAKEDCDAEA